MKLTMEDLQNIHGSRSTANPNLAALSSVTNGKYISKRKEHCNVIFSSNNFLFFGFFRKQEQRRMYVGRLEALTQVVP